MGSGTLCRGTPARMMWPTLASEVMVATSTLVAEVVFPASTSGELMVRSVVTASSQGRTTETTGALVDFATTATVTSSFPVCSKLWLVPPSALAALALAFS